VAVLCALSFTSIPQERNSVMNPVFLSIMSPEIILSLLGALISLLSGKLVFNPIGKRFFNDLAQILTGKEVEKGEVQYSEKLERLTSSLIKASREVDAVLVELAQVAQDREQSVQKVEADLLKLQNREKELQERIQHLQNVPIPVAEHFAKLTSSGEKRSARRDYILFGAGVVVSTVIAILLKFLGLG